MTRFLGTAIGLYAEYGWAWYFWRNAHEYVMSPFSLFLCGTGLLCDLAYPFLLRHIQKTERILPDGRKVSGELVDLKKTP